MQVSELISRIDVKIRQASEMQNDLSNEVERLKTLKAGVQSVCPHRHPDGSDAYREYATTHNRTLVRCDICGNEATV